MTFIKDFSYIPILCMLSPMCYIKQIENINLAVNDMEGDLGGARKA